MGDRDLTDLQRFVTGAVRGATPVGCDGSLAARASTLLLPSPSGLPPHDRLEIYREQFWIRHLASLDEDFPTLTWVLGGRDAFRALASAYLQAFPPRTWDLQRLGADLPGFVADHPRLQDDALARDAVLLDWAFMEAFDAPDSSPFDAHVLASTPEDAWPTARIDFHASLRLLAIAYPLHDVRTAVQGGAEVERPESVPTHLAVYRDAACFLRAQVLEPLAFELLEALRAGTALGEACEAVARVSGRDPLEIGGELGGWFQQWTAAGWIRGIRFIAGSA